MDCSNKSRIMKTIVILLLFLWGCNAQGQSKQVKVMLQQISALRVYSGYLQKGYGIAKKGLAALSDLKNGELNLHTAFYNTLATVNPAVRNYAKVGEIMALSSKVIHEEEDAGQWLSQESFTPEESSYIRRVFNRLQQDCEMQLELLASVLTDAELEMDDAERIAIIDRIHTEMTGNYTFAKSFAREAAMLARVRERDKKDIENARQLNGINTAP